MINLYSREILAFNISNKHDSEMVINAFNTLKTIHNEIEIFHSDRGGEFRSDKFASILAEADIDASMSKPGCPFDNAVSESLFNIFKREWAIKYNDIIELEIHVQEFVDYYNKFRIHGTINYMTPTEARLKFYENNCLLKA